MPIKLRDSDILFKKRNIALNRTPMAKQLMPGTQSAHFSRLTV
jgi:hypothetical protein